MEERAKRPPLATADKLWHDFGAGELVVVHGLTKANTPVPDLPSLSTAPAPVRPLPPPSSFFACPFCHECLDAKPLESFT
jgi:hypothetical protein